MRSHSKQLQVELDSGEILAIPKTYQAMDYGYALTVHKSQGMTTEYSKVLIDSQYWDKHLSFVAMTRHKQSLTLYADILNHPNLDYLKRTLSRSVIKDNVIDWPLNFAIRAGFNPDKLMGKIVNHLAGIGHQIKDCFNYVANYESPLRHANLKASHSNNTTLHESAKTSAPHQNNQSHHQGNDTWKAQFPVLTEYDALVKQRLHLSGYYREKLDKKVQELSQKILKDKKITTELSVMDKKIGI